jgi:hypothetical protein
MKGKPVPGSLDKERRKKMPYFAQNKIWNLLLSYLSNEPRTMYILAVVKEMD